MKRLCITIAFIVSFVFILGIAGAENTQPNLPDEAELAERAEAVIDYLSLENDSSYNKIFKVYNYICQSVEYDWASTAYTEWDGQSIGYGQTAYEALCREKAVCAGISQAITYLLEKINIPCKTLYGLSGIVAHAWNAIELNGCWYFIDATADLGTADYSHFLKTLDELGDYTLYTESESTLTGCNLSETSYSTDLAAAQYITDGDYLINPGMGNVTIHSYTGTAKNVVIPDTLAGRTVKRLAQYCIYSNDKIETLTISEGIESIEHLFVGSCSKLKRISIPSTAAFSSGNSGGFQGIGGLIDNCEALETITVDENNPYLCVVDNVLYSKSKTTILCYPRASRTKVLTIPDGVITIEDDTFAGNPYLQEVILPDSVQSIGYWAFNTCSALKKINIPESCRSIGEFAFNSTSLSSIHIPSSVEQIGYSSLGSSDLTEITVDEANPYYYATDNTLISRNGVLVRYAPKNNYTIYTVPAGVNTIGQDAFYDARLLEEVIIPEGVTKIMYSAFMNCDNLASVTLPETLTEFEDVVFANCFNLGRLTLPASLQTIPERILSSVPGTVLFVHSGSAALEWAEQSGYAYHIIGTAWEVSGSCGTNATWEIDENGLLTVTGSGKLSHNSDNPPWYPYIGIIKSCIFSEGITSIGRRMLPGCMSLQSVYLPTSLKAIASGMCSYCPKTERIIIWDNVNSIAPDAFTGCSNLKLLVLADSDAQDLCEMNNIPYQLIKMLKLPANIKNIQAEAFRGSAFEAVIIPDGCESIGAKAFADCPNLMYIRIPSSVQSLAGDAFEGSGSVYTDRR